MSLMLKNNCSRRSLAPQFLAYFAAAIFAIGAKPASAAGDVAPASDLATAQNSEQTLILIRHGEKPDAGLGQLDCQGLNRALALPAVLTSKFGRPDFIFASNPGELKSDRGQTYNYVRPLATIEPAAIQFGMPVYTPFGYLDIDKLRQTLEQPVYRNAKIVIAWEHTYAERFARNELQAFGGDPRVVPKWPSDDFDRIYVVKIARTPQGATVSFSVDQEGLNQQPTTCPGAN
jgi:hypothetical protein